jgi:hypothetical protein
MDNNLNLDQVYAPPAAPRPAVPVDVVSPYDRIVNLSFPVGVVVGLVGGGAVYLTSADALSQFDAQRNAPGITFVSMLRAMGFTCAVLATSLTAVGVLHRAGRRARRPITIDHARVYLVAATFPLLSFAAAMFGLLGGLLMWLAKPVGTTSELASSVSGMAQWIDVVHGLATAAVAGLVLTCLLWLGANWLTTKKHGVLLKLIVTFAAIWIAAQVCVFVRDLCVGVDSTGEEDTPNILLDGAPE